MTLLDPEQARAMAAKRWSRRPGEPLDDWSLLDLADRAGLVGESWRTGRVLLKVSAGLPLDLDELPVFQHHTGRERAPTAAPRELWEASGRRSAKTFRAAVKGVYAACCRRYTVAPGERPTVLILAADREQAAVSFR